MQATEKLIQTNSPLQPPEFKFEVSQEAAEFNFVLLEKNSFNLHALLNKEEIRSVTRLGSEFKSVQELEPLLHQHPRWQRLKDLFVNGSDWPLLKMDDEKRNQDLVEMIKRGNHKSADRHQEFLSSALTKEVLKGWELILPLSRATAIPGLCISPMGVVEQLGINKDDEFVPKRRLTHDLSFPGIVSNESINSRVLDDKLEPCMFGYTFLRIIHKIVQLRKRFPDKTIWIRKDDTKSAYRRIHISADTVVQCGVQLKIDEVDYLLLSLRLPFGGSPCPSEFCLVSDVITDVINDLMDCKQWDPFSISSDYVKQIPAPSKLPSEVPFGKAMELSIEIPEETECKSDVFVDDIITFGVDKGDNLQRIMAAPCTVMHALAHKVDGKSHVKRDNFIADDKNEAEGGPAEIKIVLGWNVNTRELSVSLPSHKHKAWSSQLQSFIKRKTVNLKDLQSILGRLENIAIVIPMMGHFLNNIRQLEIRASITSKNQVINKRTKDDLILAQSFIDKAHKGVSMNSITFRKPTKTYINDASEHGLGGFACHGRAWAWEIPEKLRGRAHINFLEFISQIISIWIDVIEEKISKLDCILGMGDNTASMGWLCRSNFRENDESDVEWIAKQKMARKLASLILEKDAVLYRQWFRGHDNVVVDSLSRDMYYMSCKTHQKFLSLTIPNQLPKNFKIRPVPKQIISFVSSILRQLPVKQQRLLQPKPSELAHLNHGLLSYLALESKASTSKTSPSSNKILSCPPLPKLPEKLLSLDQIKMNWWRDQSVPPCHMWHRPSGQTTGLTPNWTVTVRSALSCKINSKAIAIKMVDDENRRHYQ